MPDSDGYPTDAEIERIREWAVSDPLGWFDLIKSCWWHPDWGWTQFDGMDDNQRPCIVYQISTGGWSGNEEILGAMRENFVLWSMTWLEHRRGGHYTFRVLRKGRNG